MRGGRTIFVAVIWQCAGIFFSFFLSSVHHFVSFYYSLFLFFVFINIFNSRAIHLNQCNFKEIDTQKRCVDADFCFMFLFAEIDGSKRNS